MTYWYLTMYIKMKIRLILLSLTKNMSGPGRIFHIHLTGTLKPAPDWYVSQLFPFSYLDPGMIFNLPYGNGITQKQSLSE
jgi:hypothetical protein